MTATRTPPSGASGASRPTEEKRGLTRQQLERLRQAIDPEFVETKQGLSYMSQHEVRAELTRIFGYGNWDTKVLELQFVYEYAVNVDHPEYPRERNGEPKASAKPLYFRACYRALVQLNIRDYWGNPVCSFEEWHAEANSILPDRGEAHAMAITSVESYALRRAAIGLGDRFGLGLYDKGSTKPLVKNSLQFTDVESPHYRRPADPAATGTGTTVPGPARLQAAMNVDESVA